MHQKFKNDIRVEIMELNLASLQSVKSFTEKIYSRDTYIFFFFNFEQTSYLIASIFNRPIDLLFLNAATFETEYRCSENNLELMFQVNYLSQFYLTRLLMKKLTSSRESRIIVIGCESQKQIVNSFYSSKILNFKVFIQNPEVQIYPEMTLA